MFTQLIGKLYNIIISECDALGTRIGKKRKHYTNIFQDKPLKKKKIIIIDEFTTI